jgi:hypothetical protein
LADKLMQLALYELFTAPPSTTDGDESKLDEFWEEVDATGKGSIPWKRIVTLLQPADLRYKDKYAMEKEIDPEELTVFVEAVHAEQKK